MGFLSTDLEYVDCPNCGASRHETVIVGEDGLTHLGGTFRIVRCCDCQLAFTNPRPTEASLEQFYPADYSPHLEKEPAERAQSRWRRRLELALLRQYYGYPPQPTDARTMLTSAAARIVIRRAVRGSVGSRFAPGRLLDFGCGAGDFVRHMRGYGWNAAGLDFSPRMVEVLRQKGEFRRASGNPAASRHPCRFTRRRHHVALARARPFSAADFECRGRGAASTRRVGDHCAEFRVVVLPPISRRLVRPGVIRGISCISRRRQFAAWSSRPAFEFC